MDQQSDNLSALFEAAIEIDAESERDEFVDQSCRENSELGNQLRILLAAHKRAGSFLSKPPEDIAVTQFSENNSQQSLPQCPQPSVLKLLGQTIESELPRVVLDSTSEEGADPIIRPRSEQLPQQEDGRFQIQGEIARGGMGAILKGRDTDLGRDLAVKVLLDEHRKKPAVIQRFVEEAQIGGQLQHPGIVPVYELGQFQDERPFFTMKLVKGKTLSALLEDRKSPEEDRAKFLGIFEQV